MRATPRSTKAMTDTAGERSPSTATAVTPTTGSNAGTGADDGGIAGDVRGIVEGALSAVGRAGTISAANVADAVEGAGRSLSRRVVNAALAERRSVTGRDDLPHADVAVGRRRAGADRVRRPWVRRARPRGVAPRHPGTGPGHRARSRAGAPRG